MSGQIGKESTYMVNVHEQPGEVVFTFVPSRRRKTLEEVGGVVPPPQYIVTVRQEADKPEFHWSSTGDNPGPLREEIQEEAAARLKERAIWLERVNRLVNEVEQWVKEAGWATRRVEKKLEDARIGNHRVPALLMQEDTCRIILEPVGRSAPGAEGLVDLYLMPAYDDIASLVFSAGRWYLHYLFPGATPVGDVLETEAVPLSKEALETVLAEMRRHAATA
jgi:hypothetical protein